MNDNTPFRSSCEDETQSLGYYNRIVEEYLGNIVFLDECFTLHKEPSAILRRISDEKIDLVFDEYEIEYGSRRDAFLEDMQLEPPIALNELFLGRECVHFVIVGDAAQGKTCLLRHLCWKVNNRQHELLTLLKDDPSTFYYNQPAEDISSPSLLATTAPYSISSSSVSPSKPAKYLALYLDASYLWHLNDKLTLDTLLVSRNLQNQSEKQQQQQQQNVSSATEQIYAHLISSAYHTILSIQHNERNFLLPLTFCTTTTNTSTNLFQSQRSSNNNRMIVREEFFAALNAHIGISKLLLFVDGLENLRAGSRTSLLSALYALKYQLPNLYRVFVTCRPVTLFRQNAPEEYVYLLLDSQLSPEKDKESLFVKMRSQLVPFVTIKSSLSSSSSSSLSQQQQQQQPQQQQLSSLPTSSSDVIATPELTSPLSSSSNDVPLQGLSLSTAQSLMSVGNDALLDTKRRRFRQQKILRYLTSPLLMALATILTSRKIELSSCLYQLYSQLYQTFDNYFTSHVTGSLSSSDVSFDLNSNNTSLGHHQSTTASPSVLIEPQQFPQLSSSSSLLLSSSSLLHLVEIEEFFLQRLCSLIGFLYHCLLPYTWLTDFSITKETIKLLQIILKYYQTASLLPAQNLWSSLLQTFSHHSQLKSVDKAARFILDKVIHRLIMSKLCRGVVVDGEVEIIFIDNHIAQFLSARFLSDDDFARPILTCFEQIYHNPQMPPLFLWQEEPYVTNKHWGLVYELMGSRKGFNWLTSKILSPSYKMVLDWLAEIHRNKGVDVDDLGLIRFHLLLKVFALQEEERLLLKQPSHEIKFDNPTHLAELKESFGAAFLSILEDNPSAVLLIEHPPSSSLLCFSKNTIPAVVEKCVELLKRTNAFMVTELLLRFADYGYINDAILQKITAIVTEEAGSQSKRPAIRFLSQFDLKTPDKRQRHVQVIVQSLGALIDQELDQETIDEAAHALTNLAKKSLEILQLEKFKSLQQNDSRSGSSNTSSSRKALKWEEFTSSDYDSKEMPLLHTKEEWCLLINSAITLLMDFVDMGFHISTTHGKEIMNEHETKCRLYQCQHLSSILTFLEDQNHSTRLLAFVLLGSTKRSNIQDRELEEKEIVAQLAILRVLGQYYTSSRPQAKTLNDVAENDLVMKCVSHVFLETLGEHTAKLIFLMDQLVKSKLDLLQQISKWIWRHLDSSSREKAFLELLKNPNRVVRRDTIHLTASDEFILRHLISDNEINAVVEVAMNQKEEAIVHREALTFLSNLSQFTSITENNVKCVDIIAKLLAQYGFSHILFTETCLRILDDMLRQYESNASVKKEILNAMTTSGVKKMILNGLPSIRKKLWFGNVLTVEVLAQLVSIETDEVKTFMQFLTSNSPELRRTAVEVLKRTDRTQAMELVQNCVQIMLKEDDYFVVRSIVVLLGVLGRRKNDPDMEKLVVSQMMKIMEQNKDPLKQELAVSVLTVMGQNCTKYPEVLTKFQEILASELPQRDSSVVLGITSTTTNSEHRLSSAPSVSSQHWSTTLTISKDKTRLLLSTIGAVSALNLTNHEVIKSLFSLLQINDLELRRALLFAIRQLTKNLKSQDELRSYYEQTLSLLLQSPDGYLRETSLKLLRSFGRDSVTRLVNQILPLLEDQEHYCRRQALKTLGILIGILPKKKSSIEHDGEDYERPSSSGMFLSSSSSITTATEDYNAKLQALQYLPAIVQRLGDNSALVVVEALKLLRLFRTKSQRGFFRVVESHRSKAEQIHEEPAEDFDDEKSHHEIEDDDVFYSQNVIAPNLERIVKLLYRRRFVNSVDVKIGVLSVLGTTPFLHPHLATFHSILNSDNVTTLVEFSDTLRSLGFPVLQYVPTFINSLKPGSPLVRHLVRLLQKYERALTPETVSQLFSMQTLSTMLKNKEPNVRRLAIHLMGKKCERKPRHIWVLVQMWADRNNKVRKEVIEALGDIGKRHPSFIPLILQSIDIESVNSILVWRLLSISWGMLIASNLHDDDEDDNDDDDDDDDNDDENDQTDDS